MLQNLVKTTRAHGACLVVEVSIQSLEESSQAQELRSSLRSVTSVFRLIKLLLL